MINYIDLYIVSYSYTLYGKYLEKNRELMHVAENILYKVHLVVFSPNRTLLVAGVQHSCPLGPRCVKYRFPFDPVVNPLVTHRPENITYNTICLKLIYEAKK